MPTTEAPAPRNIVKVIERMIEADPDLGPVFLELLQDIAAKDRYLAPELARHRWAAALKLLAKHRPMGHPNHARIAAIFNDTESKV